MKRWEKVLLSPHATIREALIKIDAAQTQLALVVDKERRLQGTITDGDIRRALLKGLSLSEPVSECMCATPTTVKEGEPREEILRVMRRVGVQQIPIVNPSGIVVGLEIVADFLLPEPRQNWVVIMAGGLGTRLKELTAATPKPMLQVGARPLLETVIKSFVEQGFRHFYLAVNYKAEAIESYFKDGEAIGAEIHYLREKDRMGTAGALSLLPELPVEPLLVANGDLLMKLDYREILDAHVEAGAAATMAVREYEFQIPYGVIEESRGTIRSIREKPTHRTLVSAGVYVLAPESLRLVPKGKLFDMPGLFQLLIDRGKQAHCHIVRGYWLDIGRLADYEKANEDYATVFE